MYSYSYLKKHMKFVLKHFPNLVLLLSLCFFAHAKAGDVDTRPNIYETLSSASNISENNFHAVAKANNITTRKIILPNHTKAGYYIVSGVFSQIENARKGMSKFQKKGFNAGYFNEDKKDLNYLYLNYYPKWQDAVAACNSKLNGTYTEKIWIAEVAHNTNKKQNRVASIMETNTVSASKDDFYEAAKANKITTRKMMLPIKTESGFYLISGVFSKTANAQKGLKQLLKKGFNAGYFSEPEKKMNYLYLEHHKNWQDALNASISKLNGSYTKTVWIAEIENPEKKIESPVSSPITTSTYQFDIDIKEAKEKQNPLIKKLIKKADGYFAKLWYAEASKLYEEILEREPNPSIEVLQKAGDAYYFNTNMEKAYEIYHRLYEKQNEQLSTDYLFKYAHSLKGTGKYKRAKRLMRLYDKQKTTENSSRRTRDRASLDAILSQRKEFEIKNLAINSKYSEFSPAFLSNDKIVYASAQDSSFFNTRRYKWNNQPYLDLYVAKINEESQDLRDAAKFSKKINTKYHEASVSFSPDNTTMYFTRNNYGKKLKRDANGINNLKIYKSTKKNGEWSEAVELPFNSDEYSTGHPTLSPNGKQLYFVSDMPGTMGKTDIFVVDILEDGAFSEPRNLGPDVNTDRREMFPFVTEDALYFSSDGYVGVGGLDVYKVAYSEEGFGEVVNMGQPVNSRKDDFSYIVNKENALGYFASNRRGGKGDDDIYSFKRLMVEEVEANKNAIAGVVVELVTGDIMPKALVTLLDENNVKLKEMVTDDDGSFIFEDLESTTKYTIKTTKGDYFDEQIEVTTRDNELVNTSVSLKKLKELIAIEDGIRKLKTDLIYFNFDKWNIRQDASLELDKVVTVMTEYPDMVIKIESHTDSRGKAAYNKYLSNKRARATRDYLIAQGIDENRIKSAIGYGEEQLINNCSDGIRCSREQHELNRRSEIIIVKM